jgi:hypothetical protein
VVPVSLATFASARSWLAREEAPGGRSQQDIVREAIAKKLGMASELTSFERAVRAGTVEVPGTLS